MKIPFNKPYFFGDPLKYIEDSITLKFASGDGFYTKKCEKLIEESKEFLKVMITPSCTAALEMSALLSMVKPGDEVLLPSYTFSSTANAFALRGANLIFVDCSKDTFNSELTHYEQAISKNTKFLILVHYGGACADIGPILDLARNNNVLVIEDAAQSYNAYYDNGPLGGFGALGCISFHETKNLRAGEGGALVINQPELIEKAHIIREKGTNRNAFLNKKVSKYNWVDIGSSFLMSDLNSAYLFSQLICAEEITDKRLKSWKLYSELLTDLEQQQKIYFQRFSPRVITNGHIFGILLNKRFCRDDIIKKLAEHGIEATSHYEPLHSSPAGISFGKTRGFLNDTDDVSQQILRLPLFFNISVEEQYFVAEKLAVVLA